MRKPNWTVVKVMDRNGSSAPRMVGWTSQRRAAFKQWLKDQDEKVAKYQRIVYESRSATRSVLYYPRTVEVDKVVSRVHIKKEEVND